MTIHTYELIQDLFPVKQEKPNHAKQQQRVKAIIQQTSGPQKSILESDLFLNREAERERMMKMYTNEELKEEIEMRRVPSARMDD